MGQTIAKAVSREWVKQVVLLYCVSEGVFVWRVSIHYTSPSSNGSGSCIAGLDDMWKYGETWDRGLSVECLSKELVRVFHLFNIKVMKHWLLVGQHQVEFLRHILWATHTKKIIFRSYSDNDHGATLEMASSRWGVRSHTAGGYLFGKCSFSQ